MMILPFRFIISRCLRTRLPFMRTGRRKPRTLRCGLGYSTGRLLPIFSMQDCEERR